MGRVDGKIVVVTGAASGQGEAEAKLLAREGATVVATDVHEATDVFDGVAGAISYRRVDVASPDDWSALGEWLAAEHGRVDGLVNNAGIPFRSRLEEVSISDWNRVIAINLTGPLLGIQTVAPLMTDGGSVVNVSSVAGLTAHFGVAYTTSKWGLRGLSKVASLELGPRRIRVNTIFPGLHRDPDDRVCLTRVPRREHQRNTTRAYRLGGRGRATRPLPRLGRVDLRQRHRDRDRRRPERARRDKVDVRCGEGGGRRHVNGRARR